MESLSGHTYIYIYIYLSHISGGRWRAGDYQSGRWRGRPGIAGLFEGDVYVADDYSLVGVIMRTLEHTVATGFPLQVATIFQPKKVSVEAVFTCHYAYDETSKRNTINRNYYTVLLHLILTFFFFT